MGSRHCTNKYFIVPYSLILSCFWNLNDLTNNGKENFPAAGQRGIGCLSCCVGFRDGGLWAVLDCSLGRRWRVLAIPVEMDPDPTVKPILEKHANVGSRNEFSLTPGPLAWSCAAQNHNHTLQLFALWSITSFLATWWGIFWGDNLRETFLVW